MDDAPTTRPSLLVRLHHPRNEAAWHEFTEIYGPLVFRLARRRGLQYADAADLMQEVFQIVARVIERGTYDANRGSFRGWLSAIARNTAVDLLDAGRRQTRGTGDTDVKDLLEALPAPSPEDTVLFEAEFRRRLFEWAAGRVRTESTEAAWRAFHMTGVEGRPASEVAEALGTTVGTVYYYKSQVMARLRRLIEGFEGDESVNTREN
ncbi:RNA polymerase sigma-70 factor, ECF subfamily [Singulisphaera sp. GP187]|uniref:RNA polymerase sigma factor n=1 Tax=Singulisphaera sp. GP187 TaxID=1882752 RepID=UPI00092A78E3|nr:RNA polymerase sigma factor [Singulisphaera sp. GP187]SIO65151.1 RNA polymerase sigma-70 factor, ECF subfamily [Singulisphaera sp. GP187]